MIDIEKIKRRLKALISDQGTDIQANDKRVWDLHLDPVVGEQIQQIFHPFILKASAYYNEPQLNYTIMGNIVMAGKFGSGGGWHQDSRVKKQYKAFCYLNDILNEGEGAFEYLSLSNTIKVRMLEIFRGNFSNRITSRFIKKSFGVTINSELHPAGEVFDMDTRSIHRGSSITKPGHARYALTLYIYGAKQPTDITLTKININELT